MDIKDVNSASNSLLFSKLAAQNNSSAALGAGFASLIGQGSGNLATDLMSSADKAQAPVKEDKPVYRTEDKKRPDNKKENKAPAEAKDRAEKNIAKTDKKPLAKKEAKANISGAENMAIAQSPVQPAQQANAPVEDGISELENIAGVEKAMVPVVVDGEPAVEFAGNLEISDADGVKLEDFAVKLTDLAKMENVTIYNTETGESITMSGAELAQKLAAANTQSGKTALLGTEGLKTSAGTTEVTEISEMVADVVENIEDNGAVSVAGKEQQKIARKVADVEYKNGISDDLETQNAELAEMLDGKQKIKVEVNVKEEKISYLNGKELVKDRLSLDKAIAGAIDAEGSGESSAASQMVSANSNMPKPSNPLAAGYMPIANAAVAAQLDSVADVQSSAGVSEIGSVATASHAAGLSGAEMMGGAKAEANAKAADTSFRDIYKGMSKEAVEQVKVNITKSAVKGVDTIDVRLKPEDLGHIEIKMQIKDGKLQAHIISSRPETMDALQKEAQTLEKAFNDAGFQTDEGSLSFSFREDGQANQNQDKNTGLRNFIGEVFENEANGELTADAANYDWNGEQGLNIRV